VAQNVDKHVLWFRQCRTCQAAIIWAVTVSGKRMPLDAKPEVRFILNEDTGTTSARKTYMSHFATCPNAAQHRKPREAATKT